MKNDLATIPNFATTHDMALHEQSRGKSDEWYTPSYVFEALDCSFDMDVASPGKHAVPWVTTNTHITRNGLVEPWNGFIWMNPPFGGRNGITPWLQRFFQHGNGIALTPDRTSCPWWQRFAREADSVLFVDGKIHFVPGSGQDDGSPAQGTTLMAAGARGVEALERAEVNGLGLVLHKK